MKRSVSRPGVMAPAFASNATIDQHRRMQAESLARARRLLPNVVNGAGPRMMGLMSAGHMACDARLDPYSWRSRYAGTPWGAGDDGETNNY